MEEFSYPDAVSIASSSFHSDCSQSSHLENNNAATACAEGSSSCSAVKDDDPPIALRRVLSDPTFSVSHLGLEGSERIKLSVGDLRECSPVGDSWEEVKHYFADAVRHDREISRETERGCEHPSSSSFGSPRTENHGSAFSVGTNNDEMRAGSSTFYASMAEIDHFYDHHCASTSEEANGNVEGDGYEFSAEATAASVLKHFSDLHSAEEIEDAQWLVSYAHAPQTLSRLPKELALHIDDIDNSGKPIRLRGSAEWAPPRKQWIFSLNSSQLSLKQVLEMQNHLCAGCGLKVSKVYARRMQLCNYYNKLFCQRCHQGAKMRIPARIMHQWNFREFPVSDIARRFLLDNYSQPVINALAVDPNFYERFKSLRHIRVLRLQLVHLWSFIRLCGVAKTTVTAHGNLHTMYTSIPQYMLSDADLFSMVDLENVRNGNMAHMIEPLVKYGKCHVNNCEHCQAKGFVCELCDQRDDLLFPFQLSKVDRCGECGSLSHAKCAAKRIKQSLPCPKCVRIAVNSARHRLMSEASSVLTSG